MARRKDEKIELDSLYMVAMMKIHHELKRVEFKGFESLLRTSLAELGIEHRVFERYVESNRESLIQTAKMMGI